jgi:ribonucleoside-diphosphate reductase alpha chain
MTRRMLPARRRVSTQKVKIAGTRTVYVSVHDDERPGELFLRMSGPDLIPELIACYDIIARMNSLALQYGAPLASVGGMLEGTEFEPSGPVTGHGRIRVCTTPVDLLGRHLLIQYAGRGGWRMQRGKTTP